nr:hypothetical protein [uncultured Bifidobacterium sp.]
MESRIENRQLTTMAECIELVNQYIHFTGGPILQGKGSRTRKQADTKAKKELQRFNEIDPGQLSDFERQVKRIERGNQNE